MKNARFCLPVFLAALITAGVPARVSGQNTSTSSFKIRALAAQPAQVSLYEISFTTSDSLDPRAVLAIEFPSAFDLSLLKLASSTSINGGFKLTRERNLVRVQRTGLGDPIPPGRKVELQIGLIKNPAALSNQHEVVLQLTSAKAQHARKSYPIQF